MKAYKVVKENHYGLHSARCGDVDYKVGEWISAPDGTRLFLFEQLKQAERFCNGAGSYNYFAESEYIYECEYEDAVAANGCESPLDLAIFWQLFKEAEAKGDVLTNFDPSNYGRPNIELCRYPGVLLAKKVKLLKKVG
jgi:hypothetical protein